MFSEYKSPSQLIVLIPPIAYFSNHFLLEIKKPVMAEVYFGFLFLALLSVNYLSYFGQDRWSSLFNFKPLLVQGITEESLDKKVWVIGEDFSPYAGASKASTPYLEWSIARNELTNLNFYDNLRRILMHFENDSPEVIYDQKNVMPELMERIPKLQDKYEKQVGKSVYLLKKKLPEQD